MTKTRMVSALLFLCALVAHGNAAAAMDLTFHGFGTVGLANADLDTADFVRTISQPNGPGRTHDWDASIDTRVGLQLDAQFSESLSGVIQVLSQYGVDGNFQPAIEWANIKYAVTPKLAIRVGRTVAPQFMVSDYRLVGYSYPWARPPVEVYELVPMTSVDGIDLLYDFTIREVPVRLGLSYGQRDLKWKDEATVTTRDVANINANFEIGDVGLRFSYSTGKVSYTGPEYELLYGGLAQLADVVASIPGTGTLANDMRSASDFYRLQNTRTPVIALGINYDVDDLLLMGEWARVRFGERDALTAYNLTAGYHLGPVMPYATYSRVNTSEAPLSPFSTTGLPPQLAAAVSAVSQGVNRFAKLVRTRQRTLSAGVRIELPHDSALKLQYDWIHVGRDSDGLFQNPSLLSGAIENTGVFSLVLDFVF